MTQKSAENITGLLNKSYFWDIDINRSDILPERLVIERVFSFGTLQEAALIIKHYGRKKVEKTLTSLSYMDPRTLNFVSKFFNIPLGEFKCFTRKQSGPRYWDC